MPFTGASFTRTISNDLRFDIRITGLWQVISNSVNDSHSHATDRPLWING